MPPVEKVVETGNLWIESPTARPYSTWYPKHRKYDMHLKTNYLSAQGFCLTPCSTPVTFEALSKHLHRPQRQMLRKSIPTKIFFRLTRYPPRYSVVMGVLAERRVSPSPLVTLTPAWPES